MTMDTQPWINHSLFSPFHQPSVANRAMRRVSSVPSRAQSPSYVISTGVSPSRGSLRTSLGSGFGSPSVTDSRPLNPSAYSSTTLPAQRAASPYSAQRPASPSAVRRIGSVTSRQTSNPNGPTPQYQTTTRVGSPLTLTDAQTRVASPSQGQVGSSSPKRSGMTAVPQHLGPSLQRTVHDMEQFGQQQYEIYERMVPPRPDSLTGEYKVTPLHKPSGKVFHATVAKTEHIMWKNIIFLSQNLCHNVPQTSGWLFFQALYFLMHQITYIYITRPLLQLKHFPHPSEN